MFCTRVKEFLSERNAQFEERDVTSSAQAIEELERLGVMTTPVTIIDDEVVVGFDREKLNRLLERREP